MKKFVGSYLALLRRSGGRCRFGRGALHRGLAVVDAFLRQYDPGGATLWIDQFDTGAADDAWNVAVGRAGTDYLVGATERAPAAPAAPLTAVPAATCRRLTGERAPVGQAGPEPRTAPGLDGLPGAGEGDDPGRTMLNRWQ
jgi:hypothetical protein